MERRTAIIVVTYNHCELLQQCIQKLRGQTYNYNALVVVNNGSTDSTRSWLDKQQDIEALHQSYRGGAGGFYSGIKYCVEKGYDYMWVVNDETVIEMDTLQQLIAAAKSAHNFSFISSKIEDSKGAFINEPSGIRRKAAGLSFFADQRLMPVNSAPLVSILINSKSIYTAGLPIKDFFNYGDDIDFTSRLAKTAPGFIAANSTVMFAGEVTGEHSIVAEKDKHVMELHFYNIRNNIYISRKHKKAIDVVSDIFHYIRLSLVSLLSFRGLYKSRICIRGIVAGLFFNPAIIYPNQRL
ncbi:MAG: glycosyltransferase [Filimonas sp.]|nr:glycosyltransferase [Filimonas sp.]